MRPLQTINGKEEEWRKETEELDSFFAGVMLSSEHKQ